VEPPLALADSAHVGVGVENRGRLILYDKVKIIASAVVQAYSQSGTGRLEIKRGGTADGMFDSLTVTGQANVDGSLAVALYDGFEPALGDAFQIMTADSLSGAFDPAGILSPALDRGLGWDIVYDYAADFVRLDVIAASTTQGDFDGNGVVDGGDLAAWRSSFGVGADADGDGDSDGADFLAWQQQLGGSSTTPAAGAVPEPSSVVLSLISFSSSAILFFHPYSAPKACRSRGGRCPLN
jgi:hypothetical protein